MVPPRKGLFQLCSYGIDQVTNKLRKNNYLESGYVDIRLCQHQDFLLATNLKSCS